MKGKLTISKIHDSSDDGYMQVSLKCEKSNIKFAKANVSMIDFMRALTGAHVDCELGGAAMSTKAPEQQYK